MDFKIIPVDMIRPNPFQPREAFSKGEIEELADSIKGSGLVQPILVRKKGETYEIIAGERRWRAAQFADLKEIPAIIREVNDIEVRELSLIENWHRIALQPIEAEKFVAKLYEDGVKKGRYESVADMSRKMGIPKTTLQGLINAHKEREEFDLPSGITYTEIRDTRILREQPELRKRLLELREKGDLTHYELRESAKVVKEASEPVREALLELKIKPEEAKIIETELTSEREKIESIRMIETERKPERIVSLVKFIKEMEEKKEIEIVKEIDTGDIWLCPICNKKFHLTHVEPTKTHRFEEVVE